MSLSEVSGNPEVGFRGVITCFKGFKGFSEELQKVLEGLQGGD